MALMNCKDCGTEHSDAAAACPRCGRPKETLPSQQVVMVDGNSVTAKSEERVNFITGIATGILTGGIAGAVAIVLIPVARYTRGDGTISPQMKGMIYSSVPMWVIAAISAILK